MKLISQVDTGWSGELGVGSGELNSPAETDNEAPDSVSMAGRKTVRPINIANANWQSDCIVLCIVLRVRKKPQCANYVRAAP